MKRMLFTLTLIIAYFSLSAQWNVYYPFPESGGEWNVTHNGYECTPCYKRYYHMGIDTLIDNKIYHSIIYKGWYGTYDFYSGQCGNWVFNNTLYYHGALRDDTANKKVYFVRAGINTESLLYDFTLSAGDHLPLGINNQILGEDAIIQTVDLVNINGSMRKRFIVDSDNSMEIEIIEGIGSSTGLTEDVFVFECNGFLTCFSVDNYKLYPDPPGGVCQLTVGTNEPIYEHPVKVYPNPSGGLINLVTKREPIEITIINSLGDEIFRTTSNSLNQLIDLRNNPEGVYFCRATFRNGQTSGLKLVLAYRQR